MENVLPHPVKRELYTNIVLRVSANKPQGPLTF